MEQDEFLSELKSSQDSLNEIVADTGQSLEVFAKFGRESLYEVGEGLRLSESEFAKEIAALFKNLKGMPAESIMATCVAAFWISIAEKKGSPSGYPALVSAAHAIGFITGMGYGIVELDNFDRARLSKAGVAGAASRLKPYAELKSWVLEKGKNLGSSKAVARSLEQKLPKHLINVSDDARRFIYETLLKRDRSA